MIFLHQIAAAVTGADQSETKLCQQFESSMSLQSAPAIGWILIWMVYIYFCTLTDFAIQLYHQSSSSKWHQPALTFGWKLQFFLDEMKNYPNSLSVIFSRRRGREGCGIRKTGFWILWEQFHQSHLRVSGISKSTSCNIHPRKVYWSLQKNPFWGKFYIHWRICHQTSHIQALFMQPSFAFYILFVHI